MLEVYHRQHGDQEVLVCLDEASKPQVQETRQPRPPRPGAARACDYEYRRNGVSSLSRKGDLLRTKQATAISGRASVTGTTLTTPCGSVGRNCSSSTHNCLFG